MHTEIFTIADSADIYAGKLCMLGSFDTLNAETFPARHSSCTIVCKLRMEDNDSGDHVLKLHIIDPDGADVIEPSQCSFHSKIGFGSSADYMHLWRIQEFPMPRPGTFYIDALVDDQLLARTPLYVEGVSPN